MALLLLFAPLLRSFLLGLARTRTHTHTHIKKGRGEKRRKEGKPEVVGGRGEPKGGSIKPK